MTEESRREIDAYVLLMQDHREVESLLMEFEYLQRTGGNTARVTADVCAEVEIQVALQSEIFCPAVAEAAPGNREIAVLLDQVEGVHDTLSGLIDRFRGAPAGHERRIEYFTTLAEHVKHHVLEMETELFPQARRLKALDLDRMTVAMKKRKTELAADTGADRADAATV